MNDVAIFQAIVDATDEGRPVALATVLSTKGSVPRHAGSRMIIDPDRGLVGTIGGGCGEADVIEAAGEVIRNRTARVVDVELLDRIDSWSPAVCGGTMRILIEPVGTD